jgi:hypothetical protein
MKTELLKLQTDNKHLVAKGVEKLKGELETFYQTSGKVFQITFMDN